MVSHTFSSGLGLPIRNCRTLRLLVIRALVSGASNLMIRAVIAPARDGGVGADGPGGAIEDGDGGEVEGAGSLPVCGLVGARVLGARADGQKRIAIEERDR